MAAPSPDQQAPLRRRARALRVPPPCSCCSDSAVIRSRGRGGKQSQSTPTAEEATTTRPVSWGQKRPRTALGSSRTRDWANLAGDGPTGLIAELVLANDVPDYVRFRAVCRPWRQRTLDPGAAGLDSRFLPHRWVMLDESSGGPRRHRFLNISTGECVRTNLPELEGHRLLTPTPEGLLLLLHEPTLGVRLLNPLTRQLTDLPPVTALLTDNQRANKHSTGKLRIRARGAGLADTSTVAVHFSDPRVVAVAKPGDESWTAVVYEGHLCATVSSAGRFYCCLDKRVMVLDVNTIGTNQQPPRLQVAVERSRSVRYFSPMGHTLHLVDNAGELMLLHRTFYADAKHNFKRKYDVYKVDLDAGALVPVKGFDGRAVFMGWSSTVSLVPEAFSTIAADTLYLGYEIDEWTKISSYNLVDGRIEHRQKRKDWSLIDWLFCCIWSIGRKLA